MIDTPAPAHPVRIAQKPPRRRKAHSRKARAKAYQPHLVRHGLAGIPKT